MKPAPFKYYAPSTVDEAVAFAEESPSPEPEDALQHVFWTGADGQGEG